MRSHPFTQLLAATVVIVTSGVAGAAPNARRVKVGAAVDGGHVVATGQLVRPSGSIVTVRGRPVDLVVSPDGRYAYVKDNRGIVVIDAGVWQLHQELAFPAGGGSMHGIAVSADGKRVYATTAQDLLCEARVEAAGHLTWVRLLTMPVPTIGGASHPCGIALDDRAGRAYVCLSRNNAVAVVDLATGRTTATIDTGIAPYGVALTADGRFAWVSCWGGRRPHQGDLTAPSSGSPVAVDERGVGCSGTVALLDLVRGAQVADVEVGLHPSAIALSPDGATLYSADANSDTVSVVDTSSRKVRQTLVVKPDARLPYGSAPTGLALTSDGRRMYVSLGGSNAVAMVDLAGKAARVAGFVPAGWYPGAVTVAGGHVFVANVKGAGSVGPAVGHAARSVSDYAGTITKFVEPSTSSLAKQTATVRSLGRVPEVLRARERVAQGAAVRPRPVPERIGAPSVFEHVVYVIKENRTYDQVFGDLRQANGDPSLCTFPREVSPNHHALVEKFVLLDNFYCNGVISADGHSWVTEGNVTDHLEKAFGGFTRSYTFGDDPLTYSSTGFLWDNVLAAGLSFRNYGEMDYATPQPASATFRDILQQQQSHAGAIRFEQSIGVERLRRYSCGDYPGWNLRIPDALRADVFLRELQEAESTGQWPSLVLIYLPQDHTSGTEPGQPTPRAMVADNDRALGRIVEGISKSRFWRKTCIFVVEDDPQAGFDHVDGHRSFCLVVSPYTKRGAVVSDFFNQTSVLHTMEQILGLAPMNQMDGMAPLMTACFKDRPDFGPYVAVPNRVPLDEMNPPLTKTAGLQRQLAEKSLRLPFDRPDEADEDELNRIVWHATMGWDRPYPAALAGAHGRGLAALRLRLDQ